MHWLLVAFLFAIAVVSAVLGNRWARQRWDRSGPIDPNRIVHEAPHLWVLVALPLALLGAHAVFQNSPDLQWRLPFWLQYYYAPVSWTLVVAVISYTFSLATTVHQLAAHPQRRLLASASVLLVLAVQVFAWQTTRVDAPVLGKPIVSREGIVVQSSDVTCVPAAAANVARLLGVDIGEAEMARRCGTGWDGTSPAQLVKAMRGLGFRERKVVINRDGVDVLRPPAVVFLRGDTHAVALVRKTARVAEIWDPRGVRLLFTPSELKEYLQDTHAIEFRRADAE